MSASGDKVPTQQQLEWSEVDALSRLCAGPTSLTSSFAVNLTRWDPTSNTCHVNSAGCQASDSSPFSQFKYKNNGDEKDITAEQTPDKKRLDFWASGGWSPDYYVMKRVTGKQGDVCARGNSLLYRWCKYPNTRIGADGYGSEGPGYTDVPAFQPAVHNGVETCIIGQDYCDNRGVSYDGTYGKEDCYISEGQKIEEFLTSDVLIRYANKK